MSDYALIACIVFFLIALVWPIVGQYIDAHVEYSWSRCDDDPFLSVSRFDFSGNPYIPYIPAAIFNILFLGLCLGMFVLKEERVIATWGGLFILNNVVNLLFSQLYWIQLYKMYQIYILGERIPCAMADALSTYSDVMQIPHYISILLELIVLVLLLRRYRSHKYVSITVGVALVISVLQYVFSILWTMFSSELYFLRPYVEFYYEHVSVFITYSSLAILMLSLSFLFREKAYPSLTPPEVSTPPTPPTPPMEEIQQVSHTDDTDNESICQVEVPTWTSSANVKYN